MNQNMLTHTLVRGRHLFVIAALLAGLALGLRPMPFAHANAMGTITIVKDAKPDSPQDFHFVGLLGDAMGFSLDDDTDPTCSSSATFNPGSGTWQVTEAVPAGWNLASILCVDGDGGTTTDLDTATATIDLHAGEHITCTFTNTYVPPVPVGGIIVPVNKLELLALRLCSGQAPWLGLLALMVVAVAALVARSA